MLKRNIMLFQLRALTKNLLKRDMFFFQLKILTKLSKLHPPLKRPRTKMTSKKMVRTVEVKTILIQNKIWRSTHLMSLPIQTNSKSSLVLGKRYLIRLLIIKLNHPVSNSDFMLKNKVLSSISIQF